jgi:hypothetical protein
VSVSVCVQNVTAASVCLHCSIYVSLQLLIVRWAKQGTWAPSVKVVLQHSAGGTGEYNKPIVMVVML